MSLNGGDEQMEMSFMEEINIFLSRMMSSPTFVLGSFVILLLFGYFIFQKEQDGRTKQKLLLLYVLFLIGVLLQFSHSILEMGNQLVNEWKHFYQYPNIPLLFAGMILLNVIGMRQYFVCQPNDQLKKIFFMLSSAFSWIFMAAFLISVNQEQLSVFDTQIYKNQTIVSIIGLMKHLLLGYFGILLGVYLYGKFQDDDVLNSSETFNHSYGRKKGFSFFQWMGQSKQTSILKNPASESELNEVAFSPVTNLNHFDQTDHSIMVENENITQEEETLMGKGQVSRITMQQGIPVIMNLEDYYTEDPLEEYEVAVEKEIEKPKREKKSFIQKMVPVVEKKEEQIAVEMKPVISYQVPEEHVEKEVLNAATSTEEADAMEISTSGVPSVFQSMFEQNNFVENEDVVNLKRQFQAIDQEMDALERKKTVSD